MERVPDVDMPVTFEALPRVVLQRAKKRCGARIEDEHVWLVLVDECSGDDRVRGIGCGGRESIAHLVSQGGEFLRITGDRNYLGTRRVQRCGDRPTESPTGAGHDRR